MRSAIVRLPDARTANERRQVLRTAVRQLDRAELYIAAVSYMDLDDRQAQRAVKELRTDVENLRAYLSELRAGFGE